MENLFFRARLGVFVTNDTAGKLWCGANPVLLFDHSPDDYAASAMFELLHVLVVLNQLQIKDQNHQG